MADLTDPSQLADLTDPEVEEAWEAYLSRRCQHCGGAHARACPRVRSLTWHPNGTLAGVEFWPADRWPQADIMWPEQLPPRGTP